MDLRNLPMAAPKEEYIPAQYAKGIDVDDVSYLPGEGLRDWAEEFYGEVGGEG